MPVGTVTIAWDIRDPITTLPATGHVRVHIPHTLRDTTNHVLYGGVIGAWIPLVAGLGSVVIPDPHDPAISPTGWTPVVEVQANVLNTAWSIVIPPGSAGTTIHLDTKAPAVTVPAVFDYALVSTVTALDARIDALEGGGAGESGPPLTAADVGAEPAGAIAALAATLAPVATAGTYASLTGKPTIPAVGERELYPPSAAGYVEWTADPQVCSADFGHSNGTLLMVRFRNRTATSLTELGFAVTSAASGPGAYSGVALYEDGAGVVNKLGESANSGTSWTTQGAKSIPFTAPITVVPGAFYRAAILWQGSGNGRIAGLPTVILDALMNAGVRRSTFLAGQTGFPSTVTVSSMSTNNAMYWLSLK